MSSSAPRVFTIPASAPFLPTVISALMKGRLVPGFPASADPLASASATLYLPTRRACRLARDLFLETLNSDAAILPRIVPLGDIDEDELAFAESAFGSTETLDLPPAIDGLERRLLLAELIRKWAALPGMRAQAGAPLIANTPAAAVALADDLARLMDDMITRGVPWDRLDALVPDHVDKYWQLTLEFLKIARDQWPQVLTAYGAIEPAARRDQLIAAEAARLAAHHDGPVIAAGSTGSVPATAALLATVARLPHGAVVLPGLDMDLDEPSWRLIGDHAGADGRTGPAAGHPQFAMHGLLQRIGITRDDVTQLASAALHGRERLVSEALRPAASSERWRERLGTPDFVAHADSALASLGMIDAANAEEEALAIAIALRETIETPGMTGALITPDRALARRVVAALGRWGVAADDSGGHALAGSTAGTFARLAAHAALGGLAPVTLLALLKHPHCRFGDPDGQHSNAVAALERTLLRGPRPRAGTAGLAHALESFRHQRSGLHRSDPRMLVSDADLEQAAVLIGRLAAALLPLESLARRMHPLAEIAARHRQVLESLNMDGSAFAFHDGTMLAVALDDMTGSTAAARLTLLPGDYPDLFEAAINDRVVRRPDAAGLRVHIFGPLEARLQTPHRVILGGLIEHTWPPDARTDPWLSRPMRHELGLDPPERRIGLSAHDFAQALGAPEVILSRAAKVGGAPTVASRFVQRLAAVAGQERWRQSLRRGERYLDLARSLDRPAQIERIKPPAPRPPRNARPTAMSVTDVEHWLRDPYTIYAKHVLRLTPLDAVDTPPGAVDRGNVIHAAVSDFTLRFSAQLPADPEAELIELGRKHFVALEDYPEARAFWWPRFQRIARWFARWETERRSTLAAVHSEIRGEIAIALGERTFRLSARADRIERRSDGRYAVLDYKTGAARSEKQVRTGLAPQLTLEAAILAGGGFPMLPRGASTAEIVYVTLRGGEPAGECAAIDFREGTPDSHAELALARLCALAARFEDESVPYRSLVHPMWKNHYGNYDHLARVKEWSATGADEAGGQE